MSPLSDNEWAHASRLGGGASGFPDWVRPELDSICKEYFEDPMKDFEVRNFGPERAVRNALALAGDLQETLEYLVSNKNYLYFNLCARPADARPIQETLATLPVLLERLADDKIRFAKRNTGNRKRTRDVEVIRALLELQHRSLGTALPVQPHETPTSVRFEDYLRACTGLPDNELRPALKIVTREFARRRKGKTRRPPELRSVKQNLREL